MVLRNPAGDVFADIEKVHNVYPVELRVIPQRIALAAWMDNHREPTYLELVECLLKVTMTVTGRGGNRMEATLMTWHRQLGHPLFKTVVVLARSGTSGIVISDIPVRIPGLDACAACVAAKSVHLPHKEGRKQASKYLEQVHINIAGPMPIKSAGGREYVYVIVDDYTQAVYTKLLRLKSEAVEVFKAFQAEVERASGNKLCEVMTDNTRELSMGEMCELCKCEGIRLNTTVPYHPVLNGVAKQAIGVLTNIVRAMLHDSSLLKCLWAEAFSTATYVHNRMPTKALDGLTPYEVLHGTKPDLADLCAFSAPCAIVKPVAKLKKLDDQARMCFVVGYKYSGGGYRVWDPEKKVVVKSRDVVFFEDGLPSPPLHSSPMPNDNDDQAIVQQPPDHLCEPMPVNAKQPHKQLQQSTTMTTTMTQDPVPTPEPQQRLTVRLPGHYMDRPSAQQALIPDESESADTLTSSDEDDSPPQPQFDMSYVPDYPLKMTHSGFKRNGGRGADISGLERNGGGGASTMLVIHNDYPPVAFSAGLPDGI